MNLLLRFSFLFLVASCAINNAKYGRVELYNANDRNAFIFTVSDEFISSHNLSPLDKKNPKITVAESDLLVSLLKEKQFCLNEDGDPEFEITSRQEKIYDATFAHLIEENYRARPLTPRTYAGKCQNYSN